MKKLNKKGFTLVELLAVIVILAILVAAIIPAVTGYLSDARKGTYASNVSEVIAAVRNDAILQGQSKTYYKDDFNELLSKKLETSPYDAAIASTSYVNVIYDTNGNFTYEICIVDASGNGFITSAGGSVAESEIDESKVVLGGSAKTCTAPTSGE